MTCLPGDFDDLVQLQKKVGDFNDLIIQKVGDFGDLVIQKDSR